MNAIALRVTWELATPWCPPDQGLHLDGLLAWAAVQEEIAAGGVITDYDRALESLPLAQHGEADDWCWKASRVMPFGVESVQRQYATYRTPEHEFAERMTDGRIAGKPLQSIETGKGPYKNAQYRYTLEHAKGAVAWCVGDQDAISKLLARVTHLGRRGRLGHGRVARVSVELDTSAEERWRLRNMHEQCSGAVPALGRLRPPYWAHEGIQPVWVPVTESFITPPPLD